MNTRNAFFKTFFILFVFTAGCWALSYGFSSLAGERPYPEALFSNLEKHLNKNSKEIHDMKTWPASEIRKVEVEVESADVVVVADQGAEFKVTLDGYSDKESPLTLAAEGGVLKVKVEGNGSTRWKFLSGANIEATNTFRVTVQVPAAFAEDFKIDAESGDIEVAGLTLANVEVHSGSGDIQVEKLNAARLKAATGSGDVDLSGNIKVADAKTGSGDISVKLLESEHVSVSTGSGDLELESVSAPIVSARAGSGDVTAKLKEWESWTANARTGSGDIESDIPGGERSSHPDELRVGSGRNRLEIETGSGDIFLKL